MKLFWTSLITLLLVILQIHGLDDPYKILRVDKSATTKEIRNSYKKLAKEWHPDKNQSPGAEEKFVEINKAYELLNDAERRSQFDKYGVMDDGPAKSGNNYRGFDPFDDLFEAFGGGGSGGFRFHFGGSASSLYNKQRVTSVMFEKTILPQSTKEPSLVLFYSDWSFACLQAEPVWKRLVEELYPIGIKTVTINSEHEKELSRRLGVRGLPYVVMVLDGKVTHYKEASFSAAKLTEFVRSRFPFKLLEKISDDNIDTFLNGWKDNRVRVLICSHTDVVRIRYLATAFYFRERVAFGYAHVGHESSNQIRNRFRVSPSSDTLLLFKEDVGRASASLSMKEIPVQTMKDVVQSNQFLTLPRLSSQDTFDSLCPSESDRMHLCVVLVSRNDPVHDAYRSTLRHFAQESGYSNDKVRFVYLFQELQHEFIKSLMQHSDWNPPDPSPWLVVLWRKDPHHVKYEWLANSSDMEGENWNGTQEALHGTLARLLTSSDALTYETTVKDLIDEHAQGLLVRIVNKVLLLFEFLQEKLTKEEVVPALSVVVTVIFIVAGGYIMSYLVKLEEESIQERYTREGKTVPGQEKVQQPTPQLKLHELRQETYNGMIRLLKPGCRTVVVLLGGSSKTKLIPKFHAAVWPYRKNKSLMFGFLQVERGLEWYRSLLQLSLPDQRELNINPKNCIGTVLSLNGHRKYFCMYHAKHPEAQIKGPANSRLKQAGAVKEDAGAFMGFESSESEMDSSDIESGHRTANGEPLLDHLSNVLFEERLLDGLPNWLDRLFEGTTRRYHINYWPEFLHK